MRNLKRALSLTLASVMLLGMMVVGSSAAGFPDVDESDNIEAIEVLQAVKVMVGDDNGNFGPNDQVNRAQMAVVMALLLDLDYDYYQGSDPGFWDVPSWAAPYVAACYANGIVSGYGNGQYGSGDPVTAVQAASMMMRALGYFKYQSDYANGFELSTVTQASKIRLFDGVNAASNTTALTRNQVAQMALNALKTPIVEPDDNTLNITTSAGSATTTVTGGRVNYTVVSSTQAFAKAIDATEYQSNDLAGRGGCTVELGEKLYNGELKLYKYNDDDFYRPARTWEYKGQEVGTYMKKENIRAEYSVPVSRRTLYDLLGKNNLQEYDFAYYVDGVADATITADEVLKRTTKNFSTTGRGVLTQVFVDTEAQTIDVVSINTWLAKASADYNANRESVVLNVYNSYTDKKTISVAKTVGLVDVPNIVDIEKDEYLLVNWTGKDRTTYEVVKVMEPTIMTDSTLTKYSRNDGDNDTNADTVGNEAIFASVTTGGVEYKNSKKAVYSDEALDLYNNNLLTDKTYNVYLDQYGYAIGVDLYAGADKYVFITGFDLNDSAISVTQANANAIFLDGTMASVKVNVKDTNKNIKNAIDHPNTTSNVKGGEKYFLEWNTTNYDSGRNAVVNRWFTYTVDKDGVYTLNPAVRMITTVVDDPVAPGAAGETIKCDSVVLDRTDKQTNDSDVQVKHPVIATDGNVRVYGNDDSVYIIAEMGDVSKTSNKVITDVDGVYTGVQSVEIEVEGTHKADAGDDQGKLIAGTDQTDLYDSVYTVYDKNNYIIGSVIIGEAKGTSANYAYILTAARSERIEDGEYYWEFDAVVDGVKETLTVKSKFKSTISDLDVHHIQELRYNGEYVTAIKDVAETKFYRDPTAAINRNVHEVYDVGDQYHLLDTGRVEYECGVSGHTGAGFVRLTKTEAPNLNFDGRTLYLGKQADRGLTFVENAPAVVIQPEDNSRETRYYASVSAALASLGDADGNETDGKLGFAGRITAVLNSQGVAKWVVFNSDTNVPTKSAGSSSKTVTINRYATYSTASGSDSVKIDSLTRSTGSFNYTGTPSGWTIPAPTTDDGVTEGWTAITATKNVDYVKDTNSYNVYFTFTKDGGGNNPGGDGGEQTKYIRVTFQTGAVNTDTGVVAKVTVPVTVDGAGYGDLTAEILEDYVPAGYKLVSPVSISVADIEPTTTASKVQVELRDDVASIALKDVPTNFWVKYSGTDLDGVKAAAGDAGITIEVTYDDDTKATFPASAGTYSDAAAGGTSDATQDGNVEVTYQGEKATLAVKIYAEIDKSAITAPSGWTVTGIATSSGKVGTKDIVGDGATVTVTLTKSSVGVYDDTALSAEFTDPDVSAITGGSVVANSVDVDIETEGDASNAAVITFAFGVDTFTAGTLTSITLAAS